MGGTAIARATSGTAMGSGPAIAREIADVILLSSDLADPTRTVAIARRARRSIMANFVGTIAVDLIGPVLAALVHGTSETAFILSSARLIPDRRASCR